MSFPRYERYSSSDIPWIEELPEGWKTQRLKTIFQLMARSVRDEDEIITAFRDGEVTLRNKRRQEGFTNALQEIGYQGIRVNDLVIHAMDAFAGAIGVSDSDGKSTPVYSVCRPRSATTSSRYYGSLLRYMALSGYINSLAKGIRERSTDFRWSDAGNVLVPVPSADEQASIVRFIEQETAKIDALIEEQQRLIELLKEKRKAVISEAVTKGLNPQAAKTNSDIGWLGDIPAHWRLSRVKRLAKIISKGTTPTTVGAEFTDVGIRFLKAENITVKGVSAEPEFYISAASHELLSRSALIENDILVVIAGATTGKAAILPFGLTPANTNQAVSFVRLKEPRYTQFVNWWLSIDGIQKSVLLSSVQSAQPNLSMEDLGNLAIAVPPIEEVAEICKLLEWQLVALDQPLAATESLIEILEERRSALISAAVTGKIDVRNYTPKEAA